MWYAFKTGRMHFMVMRVTVNAQNIIVALLCLKYFLSFNIASNLPVSQRIWPLAVFDPCKF